VAKAASGMRTVFLEGPGANRMLFEDMGLGKENCENWSGAVTTGRTGDDFKGS